jgi:uncharacterized protein YqjF (DUF2071 family)
MESVEQSGREALSFFSGEFHLQTLLQASRRRNDIPGESTSVRSEINGSNLTIITLRIKIRVYTSLQ